jgi:hypothetical protein
MCCTVCSDTFLKIKAAQTILDISITINETSPIHNRRGVIAHCIDEPSTLQLSNTPTIIKSSHQQTYLNPLAATYGSSCRCLFIIIDLCDFTQTINTLHEIVETYTKLVQQ